MDAAGPKNRRIIQQQHVKKTKRVQDSRSLSQGGETGEKKQEQKKVEGGSPEGQGILFRLARVDSTQGREKKDPIRDRNQNAGGGEMA